MISPTQMAVAVETRPGSMNEWFNTNLPMRVVPVRSKFMAAIRVPYVGRKKYPFTAGHMAMRYGDGIPRLMPRGIRARVVAAWLKSSTEAKKRPAAKVIG
jgi:hypothetical protein